jgi:ribosomal protein S27AE
MANKFELVEYFRVRCPNCSSKRTKDVEDKNIVLFYNADGSKIYAKRKQCLECDYTWKE